MPLPLAAFPIVSTTDPEEAQSVLSRELMNLRFRALRDRRQFRLEMNAAPLGRTTIAFNQFHAQATVDVGEVPDTVLLSIGIDAPTLVRLDEQSIDITENWAVCSRSRRLLVERSAGSGVIFVKAAYVDIEDRFREIVDRRPSRPIDFDPSIDLASGVGAQAYRLLNFILEEDQRDDSILQNPLFRSSLDDMLLDLVLALPNSCSDALMGGRTVAVVPGVVRRAEEFLEAHATEPVTVSDAVRVCGCSRRVLFDAFRRYRGYTPRQFLTEARLRRAHMALRSPSVGDTVTSIAAACGFAHLGRFSDIYRRRYGESPSQTLRKAIQG